MIYNSHFVVVVVVVVVQTDDSDYFIDVKHQYI